MLFTEVTMKRSIQGLAIVSALALLPGCGLVDWVKKLTSGGSSHGTGAAVISFGSKVVQSESEYRNRLRMLFESQQGVEAMVKGFPREQQLKLYEDLAEEYLTKLIIFEYATEKGWNKTKEYEEFAREAHKTLDYDLALEAFKKELMKEAADLVKNKTEDDFKKWYDEQRANAAKQGEERLKNFPAYEAVKAQIPEALKNTEFQQLCAARVSELRTKYNVTLNKEFFESLVSAPAQNAPQAEPSAADNVDMNVADQDGTDVA